MPRKIRQLIKDLQSVGYVLVSQRGSHRKFTHAKKSRSVILSGANGEDAKLYQEVRSAERAKNGKDFQNEHSPFEQVRNAISNL